MNLDVISDAWNALFDSQSAPPVPIVIVTGVAAAAVVIVNLLWRWARNVVTIAHEGGHALVALLTGRRLHGIRLHMDTSGLTYTRGSQRGPSAVLTLLAGYLAPALLGLGAAWLISQGLIVLLLWVCLILLLAMALFVRNVYGWVAMIVTGGIVFAIIWWAEPQVQSALVYAGTWFMLLGAVRPVWEVWRQRLRGKAKDSDPDQLHDITRVPAAVWLLLFGVVNAFSLVWGAQLLAPDLW